MSTGGQGVTLLGRATLANLQHVHSGLAHHPQQREGDDHAGNNVSPSMKIRKKPDGAQDSAKDCQDRIAENVSPRILDDGTTGDWENRPVQQFKHKLPQPSLLCPREDFGRQSLQIHKHSLPQPHCLCHHEDLENQIYGILCFIMKKMKKH